MNAQEAKVLALKTRIAGYTPIKNAIKVAATAGNSSAYWYETIAEEVIEMLENEGFKVEEGFHRNEYTATISW